MIPAGAAGPRISDNPRMQWLDQVRWDERGLVPAIAQEAATGDVLLFSGKSRVSNAIKLLKDNNITCDVNEDNDLGKLQRALDENSVVVAQMTPFFD